MTPNQQEHHQRPRVPDYPWQGVFTTKSEVDAYFEGDTIQCLLCGKWYKQLSTTHLTRKHGVTPDEYRERYRLPYHQGLTGQTTRAKHSRQARQLQAEGKLWRSPKGHRITYNQPARPRYPTLKYRKWQYKDYEAVLSRMQAQQRSLNDVCRDPDLPGRAAWRKFVVRHPEFAERVKQINVSWPYAVQIRFHCDLSPQFTVDCQRLQAQGMSFQQIADTLGVGHWTVARYLRPLIPQRTWQREDYEAVLSRMQAQQRSLNDVCRDPDLPGESSWRTFVAHHPELVDCVTQIYASWPYKVQARVCRKLSPQFTVDCRRLQAQGMSYQQIADTLSVGCRAVARRLRPLTPQRTWQYEDYEAILSRMQAQQRSLHDVCRDPDLPGIKAWRRFVAQHPEFAERVRQIYAGFPYTIQARLRCGLSPQFTRDCQRLQTQGMRHQEIADTLGVGCQLVARHLNPLPPKRKWQHKDYEAVLSRIQAQRRSLKDVCRDPDLPGIGAWREFVARHLEFARHVKQIYAGFPYTIQARLRCGLSPQFTRDCQRLQAQGMRHQEIADTLGVGCQLVARHLNPLPPKRKWQHKDYEAVLSRIQAQQRSLKDVCRDPDLPGIGAWREFVAQHPEFAERVTQIYARFPYTIQARLRCGLSPQFIRDCQRLQAQGMSHRKIADTLGVDCRLVARHLKPLPPKRKWQHKDYEAVLSRIQTQQRTLEDVLGDPDLPGKTSWGKFIVRHPEFAERVRQIYVSWPYAVQARLCCRLPPQFTRDCKRLQVQGMNYQQIADTLGVGLRTVAQHLKKPVQP